MIANTIRGDQERCIDAGMNDYLLKPVEPDVVEKKIIQWSATSREISALFPKDTPQKKPLRDAMSEDKSAVSIDVDIWDKPSALKRVRNKHERLVRLVSIFLDDIDSQRVALERAAESDSIDDVRSLAHALKGVAANLGLINVVETLKALEYAARDGECDEFVRLLTSVSVAIEEAKTPLKQFVEASLPE